MPNAGPSRECEEWSQHKLVDAKGVFSALPRFLLFPGNRGAQLWEPLFHAPTCIISTHIPSHYALATTWQALVSICVCSPCQSSRLHNSLSVTCSVCIAHTHLLYRLSSNLTTAWHEPSRRAPLAPPPIAFFEHGHISMLAHRVILVRSLRESCLTDTEVRSH